MRCAVGVHKAVHAEVAVVRIFAKVAAVAENIAVVGRRAAVNGVVAPFPNKAAHKAVILHDQLLVLFRISGAVTHRVDVLAKHQGLRVLRVDHIFINPLRRRVHAALRRQGRQIVLVAARIVIRILVVRQAGRVIFAHPCAGLLKARAPAGLIAVRPHQHARVILVADDAALNSVHNRLVENRVQCVVRIFVHAVAAGLRRRTVALNVRLGNNIEAVFAAKL